MTTARWWATVGGVLAVASLGWGSFQVVDLIAREQREVVTRIDHAISAIDVTTDNGDVRVVATPGGSTTVTEHISEGLGGVTAAREVVGDRLVATSDCPALGSTWCSVSYLVEVPGGTDVTVLARHGDVRVLGPVGAVDVLTEHGDVDVAGSSGDLDVASRHGDIELAPTDPPGAVHADTRHGDIELVLPDTEDAYRIELDTGQGDTVNAVRSDPAATRTIHLSTRHGDVTARYEP